MEFRPTRLSLLAGLVALVFAVPLLAQTPSLAEIAKKEQERRAGLKAPTKVYTNDDLKKAGGLPLSGSTTDAKKATAAPADAKDAKAAEAKPDAKTEGNPADADKPQADQKDQQYWHTKMTQAREELQRNQDFVEALQSQINALSAEFSARDDPYQRAQISDTRQKKLAELDRVKGEIEKGQKAITDIEEEARKAGVPAGWLR